MKITSFGLSVPASTIGTVTSSLGVRDVTMASNTIPASGYMIVATSSNTMEWQDARAFGSNTADVSSVGTMGASASNTRADHVHRGIHLLSAAGSNSLYGDVNLVAGTGMAITAAGQSITLASTASVGGGSALTVEEVDGTPTVAATKLVFPNGTLGVVGTVATYTPAGGGGGLAASVLGYNTAGGSSVAAANNIGFAKKVTLAATSLFVSIGAYVAMTTLATTSPFVGIYADVSGSPSGAPRAVGSFGFGVGGGLVGDTPTTPSWIDIPIGSLLAAGDYWIVWLFSYQGSSWNIYYDGSGSDKEVTFTDGGGQGYLEGITYRASLASASRKYSLRAVILS